MEAVTDSVPNTWSAQNKSSLVYSDDNNACSILKFLCKGKHLTHKVEMKHFLGTREKEEKEEILIFAITKREEDFPAVVRNELTKCEVLS